MMKTKTLTFDGEIQITVTPEFYLRRRNIMVHRSPMNSLWPLHPIIFGRLVKPGEEISDPQLGIQSIVNKGEDTVQVVIEERPEYNFPASDTFLYRQKGKEWKLVSAVESEMEAVRLVNKNPFEEIYQVVMLPNPIKTVHAKPILPIVEDPTTLIKVSSRNEHDRVDRTTLHMTTKELFVEFARITQGPFDPERNYEYTLWATYLLSPPLAEKLDGQKGKGQ